MRAIRAPEVVSRGSIPLMAADDTEPLATELPQGPSGAPGLTAWRAVGLLLIYVGGQFVTAVVLGFAIGAMPLTGRIGVGTDALRSGVVPVGTVLAFGVAGIVVLRLYTRLSGAGGLRRLIPPAAWERHGTAVGLGVGLAALNLLAVGSLVAGRDLPTQGPLQAMATSSVVGRACFVVLALGLAPFFEEIIFRGILFEGFTRPLGLAGAALASTLLFTAMHGQEIALFWPAGIAIFTLGLLSCVVKRRSGSLAPCMTLHFSYNALLVGTVLVSRLGT